MKTKTPANVQNFSPEPLDNRRLAHLCGPRDENLRQISAALDVTVFRRGEKFVVSGDNAARAIALLERFYELADKVISVEDIQLALVEQRAEQQVQPGHKRKADDHADEAADDDEISTPVLKTRRSDLRGRTPHQSQYLKAILEHDVTFGVGPAGTGKTYLAGACAVDALERDALDRIALPRIDRAGDRQISLAGAGRTDAESDVVF